MASSRSVRGSQDRLGPKLEVARGFHIRAVGYPKEKCSDRMPLRTPGDVAVGSPVVNLYNRRPEGVDMGGVKAHNAYMTTTETPTDHKWAAGSHLFTQTDDYYVRAICTCGWTHHIFNTDKDEAMNVARQLFSEHVG